MSTTVRFDREVYLGTAVDEAVKVFAKHATFDLREEPSHWVVTVTAANTGRERSVVGEFANYALGRTIQEQDAR